MTNERRNPVEIEDELPAVRCQLGESLAFEELVARWHQPIPRYVGRLPGDGDAAAETAPDETDDASGELDLQRDNRRLCPIS